MRAALLIGLVPAMLSAPGAAAQALFTPPGDVRLTPILTELHEDEFVGLDQDGYGYSTSGGQWWNLLWWRPEDLASGTLGTLALPGAAGGSRVVMTYQQDAAWVLNRAVSGDSGETLGFTLHRFRAAEHEPGSIVESLPSLGFWSDEDFPVFAADAWSTALRATPSGELCAWFQVGLYCLDPTRPGAAGVTRRLATADLDQRLPVDPGWDQFALLGDGKPVAQREWRALDVVGVPDGRVFALVTQSIVGPESSPGVRTSFGLIWLLAIDRDGAVVPRFGPFTYLGEIYLPGVSSPTGAFGPLASAGQLAYSTGLDAVVVLVESQEFGWLYENDEYAYLTGPGLQVFPLGEPGRGYLSLASPLGRVRELPAPHTGLPAWPVQLTLMRDVGGDLALMLDHPQAPIVNRRALLGLSWDAAALDLDADLLTAAEEAALGTSDYRADSDGSGTLDGVEVRMALTDPTDWSDDPALAVEHAGDVTYSTSGLIDAVLPPVASGHLPSALGFGGPLCVDGRCHGPGGEIVTTFPDLDQARDPLHWAQPITSASGEFVVTWNHDGLTRTWFDDGRRELYLPQAVINGVADGIMPSTISPWEPVPIDGDLTFFLGGPDSGIVGPSQVIACRNTDCRFIFDIQTARCDSGLGPCDAGAGAPRAVDDLTTTSFKALGWEPVTRRLHLRVKGFQDGWLVGIHETEPPLVIERAVTMGGLNGPEMRTSPAFPGAPYVRFPWWQVALPGGELLTDNGLVTPFRSYLRTAFNISYWGAPIPIWDDTLLSQDGELVRLEHRLDPGDVVMVRTPQAAVPVSGDVGVMLYKSGPRGGLARLWRENQTAIRDPGDIDVTADGRLCIPDRGRGQLWLYEPADPALRVPSVVAESTPVPGAVACLFDGDDVLVLTRQPTALKRYRPATGQLTDEPTPAVNGEPLELLRTPSGALEVLGKGDGLRGKAYTAAGEPVTMSATDFTVKKGGEAHADLPKLVYIDLEARPEPGWPARARLVPRPDGFIFVVPYDAEFYPPTMSITKLYAVDPKGGGAYVASPDAFDASAGAGLALVPGGSAQNPWRYALTDGEREVVPPPDGPDPDPDPTDPDAPAPPEAPTGGKAVGGEPTCQGGGAMGTLGWLALALWLGGRARRRPAVRSAGSSPSSAPARSRLRAISIAALVALVACDDDPTTVEHLLQRPRDAFDASAAPDAAPPADTTLDPETSPADTAVAPETTPADTTPADTTAADTTPADTSTDTGPDVTPDPSCGDGVLQPARGETCDDGNTRSGDGCRDDCILEEAVGAGFTGGQCGGDLDCAPAGSVCVPEVGGGSCAIACTQFCEDQAGAPVTFCIDASAYQRGLQSALPPELAPALCVAKCDFERFPRSGCRDGLHCELHDRYGGTAVDEVCVPGDWSLGLSLSADGKDVLGPDPGAPEPAEPYLGLLEARCGGAFTPVPARLFRGLADTLLAMGPDGRDRIWERLCAPPAGLPTTYGLHAEAAAGRAYRLTGPRLDVVDWTAAAVYGSTSARGTLVGGPLFGSRVMVYRSGSTAWLYADAAADRPYAADPERGRHFGMIDGDEWAPLDQAVTPGVEYVTFKASGGQRFHRQWGRLETIDYLADLAIDYLAKTGVPLGIGDVSLATGGDIDDHASHEVGLDVDLYLLTFPPDPRGGLALDEPYLWVAECTQAGGWDCWYYDDASGRREDLAAPLHVPAATLLETLAWFALDWDGPSHFVQHDVVTLAPFRALGESAPRFIDATNASALGWPPHENHVHVRFFDW